MTSPSVRLQFPFLLTRGQHVNSVVVFTACKNKLDMEFMLGLCEFGYLTSDSRAFLQDAR